MITIFITLVVLAILNAIADPIKTGYEVTIWSKLPAQAYFNPHQRLFAIPGFIGALLCNTILIPFIDFWHTIRALQIITVMIGLWSLSGENFWVMAALVLVPYGIVFEMIYGMTIINDKTKTND